MSLMDHKEYIQKKVDPLLDKLVSALVDEQPDDVTGFMVRQLQASMSESAQSEKAQALRDEISQAEKEIATLEAQIAAK